MSALVNKKSKYVMWSSRWGDIVIRRSGVWFDLHFSKEINMDTTALVATVSVACILVLFYKMFGRNNKTW